MNRFSHHINEAKVQRTIDPKLWASVSSGCSKTYKNDLGVSAKPIGTRDQLLQRFVAGLIILKQQCPITKNDLQKCPAFTQWANKLLDMGIQMSEIHKLWNENCGKLPKVDTNTLIDMPDDNEPDMIDNEISAEDNTSVMPAEEDTNIPEGDIIDETPSDIDDNNIMQQLHNIMLSPRTSKFDLHGCPVPEEAFKPLSMMQLNREGITNCDNFDDLKDIVSERKLCFALRVLGGDPEEVQGDVIWCENKTDTSYYIAVGNTNVKIYYKEENGDLSLSYIGTLKEFGL